MADLNSPILSGDVSGGLHSTSVDKIKGSAVSGTAPTSGQVLTWDGSQWAPAASTGGGGGGANGLTYYLNQGTNADAPITNLPGTPKQLGRSADATQTTATTGSLTPTTWTQFAGFVSEATPQDPGSTDIPAGLWDFNVWLYGVADNNHSNSVRAKVFKYDGSNAPTLLATSAAVTIGETSALVGISVLVPETAMLVTDRIYVTLEAYATGNGHSVTGEFGNNTPSHVHTSLGLVAGTGLWKNVAGTLQSPASLLVDADVDAAAAIAQSKISGLTTALSGKAAQTQVDVFTTVGTNTWTKPDGAKAVTVYAIGGGSGGGSGCASNAGTAAGGGAGGGGGARTFVTIDAAFLGATETVTVGSGGTGGASRAAGAGNGASGLGGSASSFGLWVYANQGGTGGGGTSVTSPIVQGSPGGSRGLFSGGGGGAPANSGGLQTFGIGVAGTNSTAGSGGGAGGGVTAGATPVASSGGVGGFQYMYNGATAAGTPVGQNGFSVPAGLPYGGSAGGGGNASVTANAMAGGNGGLYGAGGGGGGGAVGFASGAGGNGAQGIVVVITHF
jgi:hypothetical protein